MGLFLDAASVWSNLYNVKYILEIARKGRLHKLELLFLNEDFPHLSGLQYARDVDFGIRKSEYYGDRLVPAILNRRMVDTKIEESRNWEKISGRLKAIINLQSTLDNEFVIVDFNKSKVRTFCQIDAKFAIKSIVSDDIYFVFLDEKSGRYYCKSAFKKEFTDYVENQAVMTVLRKIKIVGTDANVLYVREGYHPIDIPKTEY